MNWYIESVRNDESYLKKVESTVEEIMDWFCNEISNLNEEEFNEEKIISLCKEIFDQLPILRFVKCDMWRGWVSGIGKYVHLG